MCHDCILERISVRAVEEQLEFLEYRNQPARQVSLSPTQPKDQEEHCLLEIPVSSWLSIVLSGSMPFTIDIA